MIGGAHIGISANAGDIAPGSDHVLTFSGHPGITIPPNAEVTSDPVNLSVAANSNVSVSLFLPKATKAGGIHYSAQQNIYLASGDQTAAASIPAGETLQLWLESRSAPMSPLD